MLTNLQAFTKNKNSLSLFERFLFFLAERSVILCYLSILFIILLVALDVTLRRFFNHPLVFSYELTGLAFVPLIWASILFSTFKEEHIRVDILFASFSLRLKKRLLFLFDLLGALILFLISLYSILYAIREFKMGHVSEMLEIPFYPFILLCAAGAFLSGLMLLFRRIRRLK